MKTIKMIGKILLAGILAVAILSLLMCFYCIRITRVKNEKGDSDYIYPPNSVWVNAAEGISFGRVDANGFNNPEVIADPDIIVVGSSHMQAFDVMPTQNVAYLLAEKFRGTYSVYNMGLASHFFFKACQYLPNSIERFDAPPKVAIIETFTVALDADSVEQAISHTLPVQPVYSSGLVGLLQKVPFVRTVARQAEEGLIDRFMTSKPADSAAIVTPGADGDGETAPTEEAEIDVGAYSAMFAYLQTLEQRYGTQIIIVYHPTGTLLADGTIRFASGESLTAFDHYAEEAGVDFIDLTTRFEDMYYQDHHVAHGFITGELESGHLNAYGHEAMANAIYETILEMEASGTLCR